MVCRTFSKFTKRMACRISWLFVSGQTWSDCKRIDCLRQGCQASQLDGVISAQRTLAYLSHHCFWFPVLTVMDCYLPKGTTVNLFTAAYLPKISNDQASEKETVNGTLASGPRSRLFGGSCSTNVDTSKRTWPCKDPLCWVIGKSSDNRNSQSFARLKKTKETTRHPFRRLITTITHGRLRIIQQQFTVQQILDEKWILLKPTQRQVDTTDRLPPLLTTATRCVTNTITGCFWPITNH